MWSCQHLHQKDCKSRNLFASSLQGNVLAAEKPPDIPGLEFASNEVFINNEDFLFDNMYPHPPRMDSQTGVTSENDNIIFEDTPATPPTEIPLETMTTDETSRDSTANTESKLFPHYVVLK